MKKSLKPLLVGLFGCIIAFSCSKDERVTKDEEVNPNRVVITKKKVADNKQNNKKAAELDTRIRELEKQLAKSTEDDDLLRQDIDSLHEDRKNLSPQYLEISKAFLGKDLLMHLTYSNSTVAASPNSTVSKVVNFKRVNDLLIVNENLEKSLQTDDIKTEKLEFIFRIVEENSDNLIVDFTEGFNSISIKLPFGAPELGIGITDSYLKKITHYEDNAVMLNLVTRINLQGTIGSILFKIIFEPVIENKNFKPTNAIELNNNGVRYFTSEQNWTPGSKKPKINAMKWDISKEVVFHYSRNFPENHLDSLQASIGYWNEVFGKDVLLLKKLPEGVEPNDRGYNVIQWLDWDAAGSARADFKSNPYTGELLQATLHITSVFAKTRKLTKRLNQIFNEAKNATVNQRGLSNSKDEPQKMMGFLQLKGFTHHPLCNRDHILANEADLSTLQQTLQKTLEADGQTYSEEELLEIEQRLISLYVTKVIAHEIGHALGLRHNFASSSQSEVGAQEYDKLVRETIEVGRIDKNVGTSVMDYPQFWDSAFLGTKITNSVPLAYDQKAIKYAYTGIPKNPTKDEKSILFCSDEEARAAENKIDNCMIFDRYGAKVFNGALEATIAAPRLGLRIFDNLYSFVTAPEGERKSIEDPSKLAKKHSKWFLEPFYKSLDSNKVILAERNVVGKIHSQVAYLPNEDALISELPLLFGLNVRNTVKQQINKLPEDSPEEKNIKETMMRLGNQYTMFLYANYLRETIKLLSGLSYIPANTENYIKGFTTLADIILNTDSDFELFSTEKSKSEENVTERADEAETDEAETDEAETDEAETDEAETDEAETDEAETDEAETEENVVDKAPETLSIKKPLFDLLSGNEMRLDFIEMMLGTPPMYNKGVFDHLMTNYKNELIDLQNKKIEEKFEKAIKLAPMNLDLLDQYTIEKDIARALKFW